MLLTGKNILIGITGGIAKIQDMRTCPYVQKTKCKCQSSAY